MGSVVKNYANVPKADVDAMADYIKALPPIDNPRKKK
jgi:hypothetical protein